MGRINVLIASSKTGASRKPSSFTVNCSLDISSTPSQAQTLQELLGFAYYQPCSRIWDATFNSPEIRSELSASFQVHPKPELRPESPVSPIITARQEMVSGK